MRKSLTSAQLAGRDKDTLLVTHAPFIPGGRLPSSMNELRIGIERFIVL
jgi:hypothetical protein